MALKGIHENLGQLKELNSFSCEWLHNMILKDLKIFSQNIWKNNFLINTILKVNQNFDIIFIQELLWTTIRSIPSSVNCEGASLVGIPNHPNWLTFARELCSANDFPRVIIYVNVRLSSFWFFFAKTLLTIKTFYLHLFSMTTISFGSWMFILIVLTLP